ncbi:MAG: monoamine oxidase [Thermoleophilaceae bacterium]|jgi:monoamine oxidase|nr:monoamine oxidase [Thermoleophilaceae bacterium]
MSDLRFTRRAAIGTAAAGAAAAALPGTDAFAAKAKPTRYVDVVVVGAGLAGLMTARKLVAAGKKVVVIEADKRVGGRLLGIDIGGGKITEGGAEFIGETQDHIAQLAKDLGLKTFKTYNTGNNLYVRNGTKLPYDTSTPVFGPVPPDPTGAVEAFKALQQLNQMSQSIDLNAPWNSPNAAEYDSQTFETWKQDNVKTPNGRFLIDVATTSVFSVEPRDLSLLFVLFYIAAAGNETHPGTLDRLVNTSPGAQSDRIVGGTQQIPMRMAKQLGKRVVLSSPVRKITQLKDRVVVDSDKLTAVGQRVVVAIPPPLAGRLQYQPALPALRDQLTQRMPFGSVMKVIAIYDKPFWRDQGFTGQVVSDTGPAQVTFDNTPPEGAPGALMAFVEASASRQLNPVSKATLKAKVLDNFGTYFGDAARHPIAFYEKRWDNDIWHRGCPVCVTPPGVLLDYGPAIRTPVGRIHWAGTETATYWNGYMDGAVRSGERVAAEVKPLLHATPKPPKPKKKKKKGRSGNSGGGSGNDDG